MSIEAMKLALEAHHKNERHNSVAETNYWCNQYKLLAHQAIQELVKQEQGEPDYKTLAIQLQQQRTWVGLTNKDYNEIFEKARSGEHAVQLAESKLKEKNT
jgi:glucokinase